MFWFDNEDKPRDWRGCTYSPKRFRELAKKVKTGGINIIQAEKEMRAKEQEKRDKPMNRKLTHFWFR